ncbi:MAG: capsid assembly scaffolding protein Gp46 family protein [Cetobacterium sp.]
MLTDEQKELLGSDLAIDYLRANGTIKDFNEESVNKFLTEEETGKKLISGLYDKEYDKRFKKWNEENFNKILDEEIKKRNKKDEDPKDKIIREMRESQENFQREIRTKDNRNLAILEANKIGMPNEFLDFIVSDSEEVTKENLNKISNIFKAEIDKRVQKAVEERLGESYKPQGGSGGDFTSDKYLEAKKKGDSLGMLDSKLKNIK